MKIILTHDTRIRITASFIKLYKILRYQGHRDNTGVKIRVPVTLKQVGIPGTEYGS